MSLEDIENRIKEIYLFFFNYDRTIWAREEGELGALWALADAEYAKEAS